MVETWNTIIIHFLAMVETLNTIIAGPITNENINTIAGPINGGNFESNN